MRPRSAWVAHAAVAGTIFTALACVGLAYAALVALPPAEARAVQTTSMGGLLVGLACLAAVLLSAFANVHATLSYGTLGLHVGTLDEQHPWLYTAANLVRHPIAENYRLRTLAERGALRGADVVLMRELVESQARCSACGRPARSPKSCRRCRQPASRRGPSLASSSSRCRRSPRRGRRRRKSRTRPPTRRRRSDARRRRRLRLSSVSLTPCRRTPPTPRARRRRRRSR
jgi:hypothetical protein